jgi:hypothetical protein
MAQELQEAPMFSKVLKMIFAAPPAGDLDTAYKIHLGQWSLYR